VALDRFVPDHGKRGSGWSAHNENIKNDLTKYLLKLEGKNFPQEYWQANKGKRELKTNRTELSNV
jgi:hypothetical protein